MDFKYHHTRWNLEISYSLCSLFLSQLASLCVSLPSRNSPAFLPLLSPQLQVCFSQLQVFVLVLFDFICGFVWVSFDLFVGFVWFVCAFCFIAFSIICVGFVFIFYLYFHLWVCHANYVFDEMLLWTIYELNYLWVVK